jgi:hypothetical protein
MNAQKERLLTLDSVELNTRSPSTRAGAPWSSLSPDERIEIVNRFRRSGFSVDCSVTLWPQDTQGLLRVASYLLRCPVSLSRIHWTPGSKTMFYESNGSNEDPLYSHPDGETLDVLSLSHESSHRSPSPANTTSIASASTHRKRGHVEPKTTSLWRASRYCFRNRTQNHWKDLAPLEKSKGRFPRSPYRGSSTQFRSLINPARLRWTVYATGLPCLRAIAS